MSYDSNFPELRRKIERATEAGLIAAAGVLVADVKRRLIGGYTSGAFVTGAVMASVTRTEPEWQGDEASIAVGNSNEPVNTDYALFWEVGHNNIFTRTFERQERWVPALFESRTQQAAAFDAVFKRFMA